MIRNLVFVSFLIKSIISQNFSTFTSSNAASTSSSIHNGEGFIRNIEKIKEIAVSVFSPPDNKLILVNFFPGGLAKISIPVCNGSSDLTSSKLAEPPSNSF